MESENFIENAEKAIRSIEDNEEKLSKIKSSIRMVLGKEIQRVKFSFLVLEQIIEDEKSHCISELNQAFSEQMESVDRVIRTFRSQEQELRDFVTDTKNNMELIIKKMEMKQFNEIIALYNHKIKETLEMAKKRDFKLEIETRQLKMDNGSLEQVRTLIKKSMEVSVNHLRPLEPDFDQKVQGMLSMSTFLPELNQVDMISPKNKEFLAPLVVSQLVESSIFKEESETPVGMNGQYEMIEGNSAQVSQPNVFFKKEESKIQTPGHSSNPSNQDPLTISPESDTEEELEGPKTHSFFNRGESLLPSQEKQQNQHEAQKNQRDDRHSQRTGWKEEEMVVIHHDPFEGIRNIAMSNGLMATEPLPEMEEEHEIMLASHVSMGKKFDGMISQKIKQKRQNFVKQGEIDLSQEEKNRNSRTSSQNGQKNSNACEFSSDSEENQRTERSQETTGEVLGHGISGFRSYRGTQGTLSSHKQPNTSSSKHLNSLANVVLSPKRPIQSTIYKNLASQKANHNHANTTTGEFYFHGPSLSIQSVASNLSSQSIRSLKPVMNSNNTISKPGKPGQVASSSLKKKVLQSKSNRPMSLAGNSANGLHGKVSGGGSGSPSAKNNFSKKKEVSLFMNLLQPNKLMDSTLNYHS